MTPAEHYAKAEEYVAAANEQIKVLTAHVDATAGRDDYSPLHAVLNSTLAAAQVHATLATARPAAVPEQKPAGFSSWQGGGS